MYVVSICNLYQNNYLILRSHYRTVPELFHGTVLEQFPGTVLRRVHTTQLQLFQESIIIIISLRKGGVIYHVSTAYFLGKQLRVGDFETCLCVLLFSLAAASFRE